MKVLILGISGLIGSTVFKVLSSKSALNVYGTCRDKNIRTFFPKISSEKITHSLDVDGIISVQNHINNVRPDVVINCVGITKHVKESVSPSVVLPVNTLFPHQLSEICSAYQVRLIHVSSDCVFSGKKGDYAEDEIPDAQDLYGKSKALGEPIGINDLTLRISTIGHELNTNYGLLNWFLMQKKTCKGYTNAIFSGIPTVFFATTLRDFVLQNDNLKGLYHLAAEPIDKYHLLHLIAAEYRKNILIIPDDSLRINRSLNSKKFQAKTGFISPSWPDLIKMMANYQLINNV